MVILALLLKEDFFVMLFSNMVFFTEVFPKNLF